MKYRQWKKNYKKMHGVNPPLELDKRKQRKLLKKRIITTNWKFKELGEAMARGLIDAMASVMRGLGGMCDAAGTVFRNIADNMRPIEVRGRIVNWQVREYGVNHYAVYEINALGGDDELRAITYSQRAAEKIAEILEDDYLVHISQTRPDRIQYRNDAADGLRMAAITACEKGVMQ